MATPVETDERSDVAPSLAEIYDAFPNPPGYRIEIIDGKTIVTPPPDENHNQLGAMVAMAFMMRRDQGNQVWMAYQNAGIAFPDGPRFIPGVTVLPFQSERTTRSYVPADVVELVAEVTSSNDSTDWGPKLATYARNAIPLYLVVDRKARRMTLHSDPDPASEIYRHTHTGTANESFPLPAPFGFDLAETWLPL